MIKKYLILFCLLVSFNGLAFGQFNFGIKGGLNLTNTTSIVRDSKMKAGLNAGLLSELKISKKFIFRPELLYSLKGSKTPATQFDDPGNTHFHYINLPLLLGFQPINKLTLLAGPELGYLMNATSGFDGKSFDTTDHFEKPDIGAAFGLNYLLNSKFSAEVRYIYGFDGLIKAIDRDNTGQAVGESKSGANRVFQFGINYYLIRR